MNDLDLMEYLQDNGWITLVKLEYQKRGSRVLYLYHNKELIRRTELTIKEKDYVTNMNVDGTVELQTVS